jgi:hypothetical protein
MASPEGSPLPSLPKSPNAMSMLFQIRSYNVYPGKLLTRRMGMEAGVCPLEHPPCTAAHELTLKLSYPEAALDGDELAHQLPRARVGDLCVR